jgi:ferritin
MLKFRNVETALKSLEEEESEIKNTINRLLEMDMKMEDVNVILVHSSTPKT